MDVPARTVTPVGLEAIVKSSTVTVTVAEWDRLPLLPVIVTIYWPALPLQDWVEPAVVPRIRLVELSVHVNPVDGEIDAARVTVPANPWSAATVMVEFALPPTRTVALVGLAETEKSWTAYVTDAV